MTPAFSTHISLSSCQCPTFLCDCWPNSSEDSVVQSLNSNSDKDQERILPRKRCTGAVGVANGWYVSSFFQKKRVFMVSLIFLDPHTPNTPPTPPAKDYTPTATAGSLPGILSGILSSVILGPATLISGPATSITMTPKTRNDSRFEGQSCR
jgi:hypothetical protein